MRKTWWRWCRFGFDGIAGEKESRWSSAKGLKAGDTVAKSIIRGAVFFCPRAFRFREAETLNDSSGRSEEESSSAAFLTGLSTDSSTGSPPESIKRTRTQ